MLSGIVRPKRAVIQPFSIAEGDSRSTHTGKACARRSGLSISCCTSLPWASVNTLSMQLSGAERRPGAAVDGGLGREDCRGPPHPKPGLAWTVTEGDADPTGCSEVNSP